MKANKLDRKFYRYLVDAMAEICWLDIKNGKCTCREEICNVRKHHGYEFAHHVQFRLVTLHPEAEQMM